jgi:glycosyltransferase involved in cell wall biosynthesis
MKNSKTKVLLQIPFPLDPIDTGSKQRMLGTLEYFRRRQDSFEVDVVSFGDWDEDQRNYVRRFVDRIYICEKSYNWKDILISRSQSFWYQKLLRQQLPIDTMYYTPPGHLNYIEKIASNKQYDFIWIHYLDYAHLAFRGSLKQAVKVIDICDIACKIRLARQNLKHLKGLNFNYEQSFQKEVALLRKFDHILVNSSDEIRELQKYIAHKQLTLIPHLLESLPTSEQLTAYSQRLMRYDLLFVGAPYAPNVEGMNFFLKEILPKIITKNSKIRLAIVGNICKVLEIPENLKEYVSCLGFVPRLDEVYMTSKIVICPLLSGSGTKVKLQEAIAYGVPIVTTSVGASGLALQDGVNAFIKDQPDIFIESLNKLLESKELANQHSANLIQTFKENYAETVVYERLDRILASNTSLGVQPLIHA